MFFSQGQKTMQRLYRTLFSGLADLDRQIEKFRLLHDAFQSLNHSENVVCRKSLSNGTMRRPCSPS